VVRKTCQGSWPPSGFRTTQELSKSTSGLSSEQKVPSPQALPFPFLSGIVYRSNALRHPSAALEMVCQDLLIFRCECRSSLQPVSPNLSIHETPPQMHESMKSHSFPRHPTLISIFGLRVRTRAGRGYRLRGLVHITLVSLWSCWFRVSVPGPLTLRMMLRVVSSMNSTLTWVTPPREPIAPAHQRSPLSLSLSQRTSSPGPRTSSAQHTGDLHKLDGNL
jgi:hypothetical protein